MDSEDFHGLWSDGELKSMTNRQFDSMLAKAYKFRESNPAYNKRFTCTNVLELSYHLDGHPVFLAEFDLNSDFRVLGWGKKQTRSNLFLIYNKRQNKSLIAEFFFYPNYHKTKIIIDI